MLKYLALLPLSMVLFLSCDIYSQDGFEPDYVVESYLVADRVLPPVRVSTTLPLNEEYIFERAAVSGADVNIRLLTSSGNVEETIAYVQDSAGVYSPGSAHVTLPGRNYELEVVIPGENRLIRSSTLVPGRFENNGESVDSIAYQDPAQIVITTTVSSYPGRQAYFIFNVNAVNPDASRLTPFYSDLVTDQDEDIEEFYINSSGIINEENYERTESGQLTLRVPWLAVAFYGDNEIVTNAIDDNLYDFIRSQEVQTGGSTLSPGELQNIIYNVEGGIGVFGSMATDTVRVLVTAMK